MNTDAATIAGKRREEVLREFDEAEKKKRAEMERLARKQGLLNVEQTEEENSWLGGGAGISMSQAIEGYVINNINPRLCVHGSLLILYPCITSVSSILPR